MNILKTVNRGDVRFVMTFNYNNIKGRLKNILGNDAEFFAEIQISKDEISWKVADDKNYMPLSSAVGEEEAHIKELLRERLSHVHETISFDKLLGEHADNILKYPSDEYVYFSENNGIYDLVITGWGCMGKDETRKQQDSESVEIRNGMVPLATASQQKEEIIEHDSKGEKDDDRMKEQPVVKPNEKKNVEEEEIEYGPFGTTWLLWFKGRYTRSQYFFTMLISGILFNIAECVSRGDLYSVKGYVCLGVMILCLWCNICTATKRCHDLGHNGWWQLIPFYGLWLLFASGDDDDNRYGYAR